MARFKQAKYAIASSRASVNEREINIPLQTQLNNYLAIQKSGFYIARYEKT